MNLKISEFEKQRILEMHKKNSKNNLFEVSISGTNPTTQSEPTPPPVPQKNTEFNDWTGLPKNPVKITKEQKNYFEYLQNIVNTKGEGGLSDEQQKWYDEAMSGSHEVFFRKAFRDIERKQHPLYNKDAQEIRGEFDKVTTDIQGIQSDISQLKRQIQDKKIENFKLTMRKVLDKINKLIQKPIYNAKSNRMYRLKDEKERLEDILRGVEEKNIPLQQYQKDIDNTSQVISNMNNEQN